MNTENEVDLLVAVEVGCLHVAVVIGQARKLRITPSAPRALSIAEENLRNARIATGRRQYDVLMAIAVHIRDRKPLPPLTRTWKASSEWDQPPPRKSRRQRRFT